MPDVALISGASSGLGALFAQRLAARGADLVLVARRLDRMESLANRLRATGRQVEIISLDLAVDGAVDQLMSVIRAKGLTVERLINNAGYGLRGEFAQMSEGDIAGMIALNIATVTRLARAVLPEMIARRSGGVLNIASTAAFQPGPNMAVYYATKAFVLSWSEALHEEVKPDGVRVSCLCPGATMTEFAARAQMTDSALFRLMQTRPEPVVDAGLAGLEANRAVVIPGLLNKLMAFSVRLSPRFMTRRIAQRMQS